MTRHISRFATEDFPLHPSALGVLMTCPWRMAMQFLFGERDEGGVAGDTGSATHAAVAAFHRGKELVECMQEMQGRVKEYPQADLQDAAKMFLAYSQDTRNKETKVLLVEQDIAFQIAPAPEDETQAPIQVIGRLDQVREHPDGIARMWDLKTSKKDPWALLNQHTFQIAAYCIGASLKLGRQVEPGGLILSRKYGASNPSQASVFWHYPWRFKDIEQILSGVRHTVAAIRAGKLFHVPNSDCQWCEAKSPDLCLPKLQQLNIRA